MADHDDERIQCVFFRMTSRFGGLARPRRVTLRFRGVRELSSRRRYRKNGASGCNDNEALSRQIAIVILKCGGEVAHVAKGWRPPGPAMAAARGRHVKPSRKREENRLARSAHTSRAYLLPTVMQSTHKNTNTSGIGLRRRRCIALSRRTGPSFASCWSHRPSRMCHLRKTRCSGHCSCP